MAPSCSCHLGSATASRNPSFPSNTPQTVCNTLVTILLPPAALTTNLVSPPFPPSTITVEIELNGLAPGRMKFAGEGGKPKKLFFPGMEKSSISLLRMRPVRGEMMREPNQVLMVVVTVMEREGVRMEMAEVPWVGGAVALV